MREKVVLIGTNLCEIFEKSILKNNWDCLKIDFKLNAYKDIGAVVKKKLLPNYNIEQYVTNQLERVILNKKDEITEFNPTRILILKGYAFNKATENFLISTGHPIYLWTYDSFERCPEQLTIAKHCKNIFVMDGTDAKKNSNYNWMPIGYNSDYFYPEENKNIDILFVGRINKINYKTRLNYLTILNDLPVVKNARSVFMGTTGSYLKDAILKRKLKNFNFIGKQTFNTYAEVIRKSKICINIHQDDGNKPINPLFFSIPAALACQITEPKDYFSNWLKPNSEFVTCSINNLEEVINNLLNDPIRINQIALNGLQKSSQYSLEIQLKTLFNLELINKI